MKCYLHKNKDAVGTCKACSKGVCEDCCLDVGNGLACKDTCGDEVKAMNELIARSKQLYAIGTQGKVFSSGVIMYFLFAALFGGWGLYSSFATAQPDVFPILMGLGMLAIGIVTYSRQKKLKLDC